MMTRSNRVISIVASSFQEREYFPNFCSATLVVGAVCYEDGKVKDEFFGCLPCKAASSLGFETNFKDMDSLISTFDYVVGRWVDSADDCDIVMNMTDPSTFKGLFDLKQADLLITANQCVDISTCLRMNGYDGDEIDYAERNVQYIPKAFGGYHNPLNIAHAIALCYMNLVARS